MNVTQRQQRVEPLNSIECSPETRPGNLLSNRYGLAQHLDGNRKTITSLRILFIFGQTVSRRNPWTVQMRITHFCNSYVISSVCDESRSSDQQQRCRTSRVLATAGENNVVRLWRTNGGGFGLAVDRFSPGQ